MSSIMRRVVFRWSVVVLWCFSLGAFYEPGAAQGYPAEFSPEEMVEFSLNESVIAQIDGHYLRILPEYIFPNNWALLLDIRLFGHFMFDGHAIYDG